MEPTRTYNKRADQLEKRATKWVTQLAFVTVYSSADPVSQQMLTIAIQETASAWSRPEPSGGQVSFALEALQKRGLIRLAVQPKPGTVNLWERVPIRD